MREINQSVINKIVINSVYGSIPGDDNYWYNMYKIYTRTEYRKNKIKKLLDKK
jgi:hypothetical protein